MPTDDLKSNKMDSVENLQDLFEFNTASPDYKWQLPHIWAWKKHPFNRLTSLKDVSVWESTELCAEYTQTGF